MTYQPIITEREKTEVWHALANHTSEDTRISILELVEKLYGKCTLDPDGNPEYGNGRRKLRAIVHEINADETDHLILTDTSEGGYWLASKGGDCRPAVVNYYAEDSRARNTFRKVSAMKRKIEAIYGREALDPNAKLQSGFKF